MASKLQNLKNRLSRMREKGEETIGQVVQTVEVTGTAGLLSYMRGRAGEVGADGSKELMVASVPISLGVGLVAHVMGFAGVAGKYREHLHNVGDGALAGYVAERLFVVGEEAAAEAGTTGGVFRSGRGGLPPRRSRARSGIYDSNPAHVYM